MARIIRLTESDLTKLVKRVINEQHDIATADKVDKIVNQKSNVFDQILDKAPKSVINDIKQLFETLGITEYSDAKEVHDIVMNYMKESPEEMGESENPEDMKVKVRKLLHEIGALNMANWGGIPTAVAIGGMLNSTVDHPFATGLLVSWGVTGLLMGLAKAMGEKG